ncbi:uncharacterized protein LOC126291546 [Schistocerca gregaria]|uniref:uncharacterized protein LOC126291546 n=1 Tax=Schistocerca gregaria TaxID=7010 RepID=UPI00211EA66F|nr:uncharacterized protein LOC126291546 [Schistocerca gregaria]
MRNIALLLSLAVACLAESLPSGERHLAKRGVLALGYPPTPSAPAYPLDDPFLVGKLLAKSQPHIAAAGRRRRRRRRRAAEGAGRRPRRRRRPAYGSCISGGCSGRGQSGFQRSSSSSAHHADHQEGLEPMGVERRATRLSQVPHHFLFNERIDAVPTDLNDT